MARPNTMTDASRAQFTGPGLAFSFAVALALHGLLGCTTKDGESDRESSSGPCGVGEFDSTFAAIQKVVFEDRGCTRAPCHGKAASGGLDLREGVAYENLVEAESEGSTQFRVLPGEPTESFLYRKLLAGTDPGSVDVEGSPMPSGLAPLTPDQLEAVRLWIEGGASESGSIIDTRTGSSEHVARLLDACLPPGTPVLIEPLAPPAPGEGVQIAMPEFPLAAGTEVELCFAEYYDLSDVVPAEFQDPARGVFFVNGKRTRQDPQSHHLAAAHSNLGAEFARDPSFGQWACRGGERAGAACDPLSLGECGTGKCASEPQSSVACIGYGPAEATPNVASGSVGGAATAQQYIRPRDGVYEEIPIRGILYWNSHAFNLSDRDAPMHAWINLLYTSDLRFKLIQPAVTDAMGEVFGQAPFTKETHCGEWIAPQNAELYWLTTHTHKRGGPFTVSAPSGERIYTSLLYSDPVDLIFDPPQRLDGADPASRTFTYCADFNNGVNERGFPDVGRVTRSSTMPERTSCEPVACVAGQVGAPCNGTGDNAACDSSPGAGDGWCDACPITGGATTENEMFIFLPAYYVAQ